MSSIKITPVAFSLSSSTLKRLTSNSQKLQFHRSNNNNNNNNNKTFSFFKHQTHCRATKRSFTVSMSSSSSTTTTQPFEICVKESVTTPNKLGDCPFCQRVLLTLEEKHLPYDMKLVDLTDKPEWFNKINPEGKVPVMKLDEKWVADSDFLAKFLEEKFPDPPLSTPPEKGTVGAKIFPTFVGFLKSNEEGKKQELLNELTTFNDYLKENGPFINGEQISAADLSLGPKLYHMEIALGHYKNWSVPASLEFVKSYMKNIFSRDSFVKTTASPEDVIAGWAKHIS